MTDTPKDLTAPEAVERPIRFRPVVSADGLAAARMDRNGNYVMYADYAALSAALEAEKARAEAAEADLTDLAQKSTRLITQLEAERDALKAELAEAVEVLRHICAPQYGLQGIIEDGDSDEERARYFSGLCGRYQAKSRAFIARHQKETET